MSVYISTYLSVHVSLSFCLPVLLALCLSFLSVFLLVLFFMYGCMFILLWVCLLYVLLTVCLSVCLHDLLFIFLSFCLLLFLWWCPPQFSISHHFSAMMRGANCYWQNEGQIQLILNLTLLLKNWLKWMYYLYVKHFWDTPVPTLSRTNMIYVTEWMSKTQACMNFSSHLFVDKAQTLLFPTLPSIPLCLSKIILWLG